MSYLAVLIVFLVFAAVVLVSRYVSLGSLIGAAAMPLILFLLHAPLSFTIICAIMAVLIFIKHKDNIRRLREGREHRIVAKSA
jgi:glycerol-3-phosphate acyltransferase PlsY